MKNSFLFKQESRVCLAGAIILLACCFIFINQAAAQTAVVEKKRLCVGPILAIKSAAAKADRNRQGDNLRQVLETLDTTLIYQVNTSRKFEVVARKDSLKSLLQEQEFGASGNVDPATAAQVCKLAGAQYLVITTITDFTMGQENVEFSGIGVSANRESVRVSCSVEIYDTTTGKLIESARFRGHEINASGRGNSTDEGITLTKITDRLATDILNRVVDVIYPAKVVAKLGTQVTINRGDNAGISVGQTWSVYGLGPEIVDPDTGEKLGRNEAEVGKIKISRITPKLSYGETVEDTGIVVGSIARPASAESVDSPEPAKPAETNKLSDKVKGDF
jgi:curli biogenesis system outer membrane secretion channel CsgG